MKRFLVQQYLEQTAKNDPSHVAVKDGQSMLTYAELDKYSNRLANSLNDCGVKRQDRVVYCLQRTVAVFVATMGILKSDAIYVPIDSKAPLDRWKAIFDDCSPAAIICDQQNVGSVLSVVGSSVDRPPILQLFDSPLGDCGYFWKLLNGHSSRDNDQRPRCYNSPQDIAYILYTSGSTGRPKGVMISHQNISNYIDWAVSYFRISKSDRILGTAPFHFDMSTFDVFCSLKAGSLLCIASDEELFFPKKLVELIEREGVTLWKGVSSLLMYMSLANVLQRERMPSLSQIIFAGEPFPTKYLQQWMSIYPKKKFYNGYGPTEATGVSLCYHVEKMPVSIQEKVPIGVPRDGMNVYLYSRDNTPVKQGEVGELCLSGPGLSRGYLNDPQKTSVNFVESFVDGGKERIYKTGDLAVLQPCGNYQFVGRRDRQLKFMGYRIEACEVERAIVALEGISDAAVVLQESKFNKAKMGIVAFFEASGNEEALRDFSGLKNFLPSYMLPKRYIKLDKIPRCNRGKVNYEALNSYIGS